MILAIDVYYIGDTAKAVGVLFDWKDQTPQQVLTAHLNGIEGYVPGEFYKRELPCLLEIIEQVDISTLAAILVDGHVYISEMEYGLGGKLYEILNQKIPIIGVAKNSFHANRTTVKEVYRGESSKPLYVSAIGIDLDEVTESIKAMKGAFRMPDILKKLDNYTKLAAFDI